MKRFFLVVLVVLALAAPAWGSPLLVCDPDVSDNPPAYYKVTVDGAAAVNVTPQAVTGGVRLHYDVAGLDFLVTHQFSVSSCKTNDIGTEVCSTAVGFTYTAPVAPSPVSGVRLER